MFTTDIKQEKTQQQKSWNWEKFCARSLCCFYVVAEVKDIRETDEKCDNP